MKSLLASIVAGLLASVAVVLMMRSSGSEPAVPRAVPPPGFEEFTSSLDAVEPEEGAREETYAEAVIPKAEFVKSLTESKATLAVEAQRPIDAVAGEAIWKDVVTVLEGHWKLYQKRIEQRKAHPLAKFKKPSQRAMTGLGDSLFHCFWATLPDLATLIEAGKVERPSIKFADRPNGGTMTTLKYIGKGMFVRLESQKVTMSFVIPKEHIEPSLWKTAAEFGAAVGALSRQERQRRAGR